MNIQIDGNRGENPPLPGGGNIEIGGANEGQIVQNVRSFNPRSAIDQSMDVKRRGKSSSYYLFPAH